MKKTKIVSTLGPASNSVEIISQLIESGANVFRFNFSHGDHEEQLSRMTMVREAVKKTGKDVGILLDTKELKSVQLFKAQQKLILVVQDTSNLK